MNDPAIFRFEHREYLLILLVIPVLTALYLVNLHRTRKKIRSFGDPELVSLLMPDLSQFRKNLKFLLLLGTLSLIIVALARPQFGSKLAEGKREGIEIIIALDVSSSMLANDVSPNRLERAKQELSRLLDRLDDDRIGLVVFAGDAYTQIPVTNDFLSAKMFLSGISTQMISRQGTAIAEAIELAMRSFNFESQAGKAIVIISDGENHEGGVSEAIRSATDKGVKIFTVGMGTSQGGRIPLDDNPYQVDYHRDSEGNFVVTRLNESMLMEIAAAGGGEYYRATTPGMGMNNMLAKLKALDKEETAFKVFTEYEEQFPALIWLALGILFLDLLILERRNRWLKQLPYFNRQKR